MKRILILIQFLGTNYSGWQTQPQEITVQGTIEEAIFQATGERVSLFSSGRTDAGVHALAMPAHFDTNTRILPQNIYKALNSYLPNDIKILSSNEVSSEFHARFDVKEKTYEYKFYVSNNVLPYFATTEAQVVEPFDYELANSCVQYFIGNHDWKGFCSAKTATKSTIRTITNIKLSKNENHYVLSVTGDGFLYNMVRIIAGTVIEVGQGKINPVDIPDIIKSMTRTRAGRTAPACGLVLKEVKY